MKKGCKQGQVTIFIILAIIIVVVFGLYFMLKDIIRPDLAKTIETNPELFMQACVEEDIREAIDTVIIQGGFLNPGNYKMYKDAKAAYLCYNIGLFGPCINQHPMFLNEISFELKNHTEPVVEKCFVELKESFEELGFDIELGEYKGINIILAPQTVFLEINRSVSVTKAEESVSFKGMRIPYKTSLYELAGIAVDIAKAEARFCYFEYIGYMALYPRYLIEKKVYSDSSKVYSIKDKYTEEEMRIAIRGCAL